MAERTYCAACDYRAAARSSRARLRIEDRTATVHSAPGLLLVTGSDANRPAVCDNPVLLLTNRPGGGAMRLLDSDTPPPTEPRFG